MFDKWQNWIGLSLCVVVSVMLLAIVDMTVRGANAGWTPDQAVVSPTPVRVTIPTAASVPTQGEPPTEIPPTFTPTDQGPAQLQAREGAGSVNVRLQADPDSEIVGTIQFGDLYVVTGRYFRWLQIRYEASPSRHGFIFEELVEIIGDQANIPDLTESALPTQDTTIADTTATWQAVEATPGALLTITADARVLEIPAGANVEPGDDGSEADGMSASSALTMPEILPTFTFPPNLVALAPTQVPVDEIAVVEPSGANLAIPDGIPPIVPIVVLAGLGVVGLLIGGRSR
jgi:hypothetical protein